MKKWVFRILFAAFFAVFVFSAVSLFLIFRQYKEGRQVYENAVDQFVRPASVPAEGSSDSDIPLSLPEQIPAEIETMLEASSDTAYRSIAPFEIDFDALKNINEDIVGWIYCEGTTINYPVLQAEDNDYYLHKSYDRSHLFNGSIFVEARNQRDFQDYNTIIYGHNMRDGSMFAELEEWQSQSFYEEHRYCWLFTPKQDYIVVFFSGYVTESTSDSYQVISEPGYELDEYLQKAVSQSDFSAGIELDPTARYVLLSTCSYVFSNSRYVLHGMLVPVGTVGGKPVFTD